MQRSNRSGKLSKAITKSLFFFCGQFIGIELLSQRVPLSSARLRDFGQRLGGAMLDVVQEIDAVDDLHGEKPGFTVRVQLEEFHNIGMVHTGQHTKLAFESRQKVGSIVGSVFNATCRW